MKGARAASGYFRRSAIAARDISGPRGVRLNGRGRAPAGGGAGRRARRDALLVRREQLLRSTAVCRSSSATSDLPHAATAFCCGLPLPQRFHMPGGGAGGGGWAVGSALGLGGAGGEGGVDAARGAC